MSALMTAFLCLATLIGLSPATSTAQEGIQWYAMSLAAPLTDATEASTTATTTVVASKKVAAITPVNPAVPVAPVGITLPATTTPESKATEPAPLPKTTATASLSALESAILSQLNAARAASGLAALRSDSSLVELARAHSADMLSHDYFSHTDLSGCTAVCRYDNAGYAYWAMGENIFWMDGFDLSADAAAEKVIDSWQNSPGHRENDLGDYTHVGIGVAESGTKVYVTADFAKPR